MHYLNRLWVWLDADDREHPMFCEPVGYVTVGLKDGG
jgi:hypothetical protein